MRDYNIPFGINIDKTQLKTMVKIYNAAETGAVKLV